MITRKSFSKSIVWVLLLVVAGIVSCKKETVTPADNSGSTDYTQVDQQFYGLLQDWYLWYDKIRP